MKRFYKVGLIVPLIALISAMATMPVFAVEPSDDVSSRQNEAFLSLDEEDNGVARIRFGNNLLYAGNDAVNSATVSGLLLSLGNRMEVRGNGEYNVAAANILEIHGITKKDLFAAGNVVLIANDAKIGHDVYIAGNEIRVESDLSGNLAIAASKITFVGVTIDGDVNLNANQIVFEGEVSISGTLTYNNNAEISGQDNASIMNIETYTAATHEASAAELWAAQAIEAVGTLIVALILIVAFPGLKKRIAAESDLQRFGTNFLSGLGFLIIVPVLSILLMISVFGMKAGLMLLVAWFFVVCLTGVFTGLWLGRLIVERIFRSRAPFAIEAAIGILVLNCLLLIPGADMLTSFFSVVFGAGLMVSCIRPPKEKPNILSDQQTVQLLENPFRGQSAKQQSAKTSSKTKTTSSGTKARNSKQTKAKSPTRKSAQKK